MNTHIRSFAWVVMAAAAAFSMPAGAEVRIYGRANLSLDYLDNGDDSGLDISSNSSRIGFKVSTDIAEGLKGIMQLEQEIRFDNGAGTFATRDSYAGVEGGFGAIRAGYFDTPLKKVRSEVDLFNDQMGDARNLTRLSNVTIAPAPALTADFDTRFYNSIQYSTPVLSSFVIDLDHSTNNGTTTNPPDDEATADSIGLSYKTGDLYLGFAGETQESRNDSAAVRFGARYNPGNLSLVALLQRATVKPLVGDEIDINTLGFGASYKLTGNTVIKGQVYNNTDDRDASDARMLALGLDHSLSKQFRLQFVLAGTDNDDQASYKVTAGGHGDQIPAVAGEQATGISAGIRYDFE
ncbi:MAG TPA: porin [Gammaproteobacteria bacterium]|nr:porin [Gammaproteobacteria bacterium]